MKKKPTVTEESDEQRMAEMRALLERLSPEGFLIAQEKLQQALEKYGKVRINRLKIARASGKIRLVASAGRLS